MVYTAARRASRDVAPSGMLKERLFGGTWFGRTVFETFGLVPLMRDDGVPDLQIRLAGLSVRIKTRCAPRSTCAPA